jgi:lysophospholipase L1-like esterase
MRYFRTGPPLQNAKILWIAILLAASPLCVFGAFGNLGAMGDSLTDEYWDSGVATYASNWVSVLVQFRGVNMGPTAAQAGVGTWDAVRNAGYEFNWADSGATSADMLSQGQDTGLASQVISNNVVNGVLDIGANDFNPAVATAYESIYYGFWTSAQTQSYVNQTVSNIETALATTRRAGISMVLGNILDPGLTPAVQPFFTSAGDRQLVANAIQNANAQLKTLAQKYQVPLMDWYGLGVALLGTEANLKSTVRIGNVVINMRGSDPGPPKWAPTNAFVSDGFHPNTVVQELFANLIIQAFDSGYGASIPLFSETQILNQANITYGGTDTLQSVIGAYSNYIILPTLPKFAGMQLAGTNLTLSFTTVSNQTYAVQFSSNLLATSWAMLTNNIAGTGGTVTVNDKPSMNVPARFYRVRQLP